MGTRSANGLACFKRLLSDGHASEAVDGLREWLGLRPNDAEAWKILAAALFELEDWAAASDAARRVTELRPGNARDWCNLGTVLRKLGDHHGAERAQRLALDLDPTYHRATSELTKLGRGSRAEPHQGASEGGMTTGTHRGLTRGAPHDTQPVPRSLHGWRDSRGWLRLAGGAALVLLVLGSTVVGGLRHEAALEARSREERLQQEADARRQRELAELARRRAAEIEVARRFEIEQQMMRNTVEYLDSFQSTGRGAGERTDAQRKASWDQEFGGQWVRWEGHVAEVSGRGGTCSVTMRCGRETVTSDTTFELERAAAISLNRGQLVRIEGRLADHNAFGYTLTDVRVVAKW